MLLATVLAGALNFEAVQHDFPTSTKNLRQWDSPTIADLDQDGWPDLLLNDHGFSVRVMWNNQGKFAKPYDLIMGDMHGLAVADYDNDGLNEIVISRGGGSGSNARNSLIMQVEKDRTFSRETDFDTPLELMRGRTVKFVDLDLDGDLDLLNFAFPSGEKKGKSESYLYENVQLNGKTQLVKAGLLPAVKGDGQKTLITDFNQDSIPDLIIYGHKDVAVYQGDGEFNFTDVTKSVLPENYQFVNNVIELDADNDGDLDLFFTRGKPLKPGETFYDPETQLLGFYNKRGKRTFSKFKAGDVINLVNFQSQWPHKSLYLGESAYEYQYPGETHSGRDVRLVVSDVLGFPEQVSKKGLFLGYVGNQEWRLVSNTWAPMSGVISGVSSFETKKPEAGLFDVLLVNKDGKFTAADSAFDVRAQKHSHTAVATDIDNNGWQDILVVNRGDLISENVATVYLNKGEGHFVLQTSHAISTHDLGAMGMGISAFDYDNNGTNDIIIGNERGKWHLFNNKTSQNNFVAVAVKGDSKLDPLGAEVKITACGKQQIKTIADDSAQYAQSAINPVIFGLGDCE